MEELSGALFAECRRRPARMCGWEHGVVCALSLQCGVQCSTMEDVNVVVATHSLKQLRPLGA
jgi:hypothetical protein